MDDKETFFLDAKDILNHLAVIIRTSVIHSTSNEAVTSAIDRLISILKPLFKSANEFVIELRGDFFYINETRMRLALEYLQNFEFLIREFKKRELGSIVFKGIPDPGDFQTFLKAFVSSGFSHEPFEEFAEKINETSTLSVGKLRKISENAVAEGAETDIRKTVKKAYFTAVSQVRSMMKKMSAGEGISIKKTKRIVESMVDLLLEQEQLLMGMTAIKDYDEYTYHHSVNVSILSISLGYRLGLGKLSLTELGMAALFHDIGKVEIPKEILNKPTSFTDDEWAIMKKHPFWGVRAILRLRGVDRTSVRAAIVAFEHHLYCDFSGYPRIKNIIELDFYSRIVTLADQYDGMTSARVYSRTPIQPEKALSIMMESAEKQLDPILFKFFINMVGVFPVGTLVMIDTKELGLVYQSEAQFVDRPKVLIIINGLGEKIDGKVVSLTEKDSQGKFTRTIIKTMDPNKYNINLADYLL